jgi:hypothetical protein
MSTMKYVPFSAALACFLLAACGSLDRSQSGAAKPTTAGSAAPATAPAAVSPGAPAAARSPSRLEVNVR